MKTAEKLGLLPGFGWMTDHRWSTTYAICLAIVPFGLWAVQLIVEGRAIKLDRAHNYLSFCPGDLFLGLTLASTLNLAQYLPAEQRWYNSTAFHLTAFIACFAGALGMTWLDLHGGGFTMHTILAPTKLYHNILVYWLYAYLLLTTLIAVTAGGGWSMCLRPLFLLAIIGLLAWAYTVKLDSSFAASIENGVSTKSATIKAANATPPDWRFFDGPRRFLEARAAAR